MERSAAGAAAGSSMGRVGAATDLPLRAAAGASLARDLELSDAAFHRIRTLIYQRAGIVLGERKRDLVYSRLGRRLRRHHLVRFGDYLAALDAHPESPEWTAFTNALTTNLTSFFREHHHFPLLAAHVAGRRAPIRVWCAAASTGQEPYSIAIQLAETLGPDADFQVLATDIDTDALAVARRGVYPLAQIEQLDPARRQRFFQRGNGRNAGRARVRPALASHVTVANVNLVGGAWPVAGPFDAVFCRNVMIYFDERTQAGILRRFAGLMRPDALLFVGHSENFVHTTELFRLRGQTVYTLAAGGTRPSASV